MPGAGVPGVLGLFPGLAELRGTGAAVSTCSTIRVLSVLPRKYRNDIVNVGGDEAVELGAQLLEGVAFERGREGRP